MPLDELVESRNQLHRNSDAQSVLRATLADTQLGKIALVSSFGAESVVLLHMLSEINKDAPVIFLDTEMLFAETLDYQREVAAHLGLRDVRVITPDRDAVLQEDVDGLLHQADKDACCHLRKTRPLAKALAGFDGWITGRKQFQGGTRAALPLFEQDGTRVKINPLVHWNASDLNAYITAKSLPRHPLVAKGYPSIGCAPCTSRVGEHEAPRAGRWRDSDKTECGIHFVDGKVQKQGQAA